MSAVLPVTDTAAPVAVAPTPVGTGSPVAATAGRRSRPRRLRVLVAEDDDDLRALLVERLAEAGYETFGSEDGLAAWERLQAVGAEAVVTDLAMPRLSEKYLCRRIQEDPALRDLPVIVYSGSPPAKVALAFLDCPPDGYIPKGDLEPLLEAVREAIERREAR